MPLPSKGDATATDYDDSSKELSRLYNQKYKISGVLAPPIRSFFCPGCDTPWTVIPIQLEGTWLYWGRCPDCHTTWANLFKLKVQCPACSKINLIWSKNPRGSCDCLAAKSPPSPRQLPNNQDLHDEL